MKKIIGFILLIILVFVVAELLLPISFVRAPRLKNLTYEYVMKDVFKEKDPLVTDIAMLGAHDAFSSGIGFSLFQFNLNLSSFIPFQIYEEGG